MRRVPVWFTLLSMSACSWPTGDSDRNVAGTIVLTNVETAPALIPGRPFVSVVSRIDVQASNNDGDVVATTSVNLQRYDSAAVVSLEVPEGFITFNVEVESSANVVVYSGQVTADVSNGFSVQVALAAVAPVLVIQDDTVRTTGVPATFRVYNAGASTLDWSIGQANCAPQCNTVPRSGRLLTKLDDSLVASVLSPAQPSTVFLIDVISAEGMVTAVWVYTRPTVASVNVLPDSAVLFFGNTQQFTAVVQANAPTGVTWSSTNSQVATVTSTGLVRGTGGGIAFIRAISQVDPTKRDSSKVTVTNPIGDQAPARAARPPR